MFGTTTTPFHHPSSIVFLEIRLSSAQAIMNAFTMWCSKYSKVPESLFVYFVVCFEEWHVPGGLEMIQTREQRELRELLIRHRKYLRDLIPSLQLWIKTNTNALCCCLWKTKNSISLGGRDNILLRAVTLLYLCLGIKIWAQLTNSKLTNGSMQRLNFVESTLFFLVRSWFWRFNGKFTSLTTRSQRRKFLELKMVFAWVWE